MTRDEQARQRLVEIALADEFMWRSLKDPILMSSIRQVIRKSAGLKDHTSGSWCAAGLTDAMERAGLLVPAPGTPARRGAIALLDFVTQDRAGGLCHYPIEKQIELAQPGDIIAWLQHPRGEWRRKLGDDLRHAFSASENDCRKSLCGEVNYLDTQVAGPGKNCKSCAWGTRKGHVAVIVAVDDESITTVGWNEGPAPGRVMMRRLWRSATCHACDGQGGGDLGSDLGGPSHYVRCKVCGGKGKQRPSATVLARKRGLLYGIARPVVA